MVRMTQRLEDYLEAVYTLIDGGRHAQVKDIAALVGVKMPSVVKAIRELKKLDLVVQEPWRPIELTDRGLQMASHVRSRHTLLRSFLVKLGVSLKNADRDACRMEHVLSVETLDRIREYTGKTN